MSLRALTVSKQRRTIAKLICVSKTFLDAAELDVDNGIEEVNRVRVGLDSYHDRS